MGVELALPGYQTDAYVEWEEYPRNALIAAMRAGYFHPAPIWDDVKSFDAKPFAGRIDCVTAGYPCQPFSTAGRRKGEHDPRHLWPHVARIIEECEANWAFLENVQGHVSLGLETVLRDLRNMGFTPAAGLFTAAETGAPHERKRIFILAHRSGDGRHKGIGKHYLPQRRRPTTGRRFELVDAGHDGRWQNCPTRHDNNWQDPQRQKGDDRSGEPDPILGDTQGGEFRGIPREIQGKETLGSPSGQEVGRNAPGDTSPGGNDVSPLPGYPPRPGDTDAWQYVLRSAPDMAPAVSLFEAYLWWRGCETFDRRAFETPPEPGICRVLDGLAARSRALHLLGNGVCPLEAAQAFRSLGVAHGLRPLDLAATAAKEDAGTPATRADLNAQTSEPDFTDVDLDDFAKGDIPK